MAPVRGGFQAVTHVAVQQSSQMPFADYDSFDECTRAHSDKADPEAYCAQIHYEATGEWPSEKLDMATVDRRELLKAFAERGASADEAVEAIGKLGEAIPVDSDADDEEDAVEAEKATDGVLTPGDVEQATHRHAAENGEDEDERPAEGKSFVGRGLDALSKALGIGDGESTEKAAGEGQPRQYIPEEGDDPAGEWIPYQGPRGGQGWRNTQTGEVVYQDRKPQARSASPEGVEVEEPGRRGAAETAIAIRAQRSEMEGPYPNPDRDIPAFEESERMDEAIAEVNSQPLGGFTLNADLTEFEGGGYVVTVTSRDHTKSEGISKAAIIRGYQEWLPMLNARPGMSKIGAFAFPEGDDRISVDLNIVVQNREQAVALGEMWNQHSIWDANAGDVILTGGSGESPLPTEMAELARRVDADIAKTDLTTPPTQPAQAEADATGKMATATDPSTTMTTYTDESGEEYAALHIHAMLRSGTWRAQPTGDGTIVVIDDEGAVRTFTPVREAGGDEQ